LESFSACRASLSMLIPFFGLVIVNLNSEKYFESFFNFLF